MPRRVTSFALLLAASAAAQGNAQFISPAGTEFFEANGSSDIMLGAWAPNTRYQQTDINLVGKNLLVVRFLGWRRNGSSGAGAAKATDLTVIMSHADYATITTTFASNYKDAPKTVFTRKSVNLPDWNAAVSVVPSPFDLVLPLDTPFIYNGVDALLYDVLNENNPATTYTMDWVQATTHTYGDYPSGLGGGCQTSKGPMTHRCALRASAATFDLGFKVSGAPSAASVAMLVGSNDPQLTIPGLCGVVHTQPLLSLNVGTSDASGNVPLSFGISTPWNPAYVGLVLFTQAAAPDATQPGIPVAISDGQMSPGPKAGGPAPINAKRVYHTSSATATVGIASSTAGVPTLFGY